MIHLTKESQIFVATKFVDFRKQIDGLIAVCEQHLSVSPRNSSFFVFINRSYSMIRILHYDFNGYWLATKGLSEGQYKHWPQNNRELHNIQAHELNYILKNIIAT